MVKFSSASKAYNFLNGLICIYKPPCVSTHHVQHKIITNICRDLNALPDRPLEQRVEISGPTNAPMTVAIVPNYADHPLVCGPRYIQSDLRCRCATILGYFSSGVLLLGINEGTKLAYHLNAAYLTRAYKVHGQLGKATDTYFWNGKTVERTSFGHVNREKIDRIVAHMQAAHQKTMFELSGLHMDSQSMYDIASKGPIRPANSNLPVLYGIKCVYFEPPNFTLEVQAVNEYERYLWTLVHDLGVQLKSSAHCTGVQCIRQGKFDIELALLQKHWKIDHITENMDKCRLLLEEHNVLLWPKLSKLSV